MKRLFVRLVCLLLCLAIPASSLAEWPYLIWDSNRRELTREELWEWDLESLGYILNEIFARHGYNFIPGQKYDYYFRCMPWYTPNDNPNNSKACYPKLSAVEWDNQRLVKDVMNEMRDLDTTNEGGKSVWDYFAPNIDTLQGFEFIKMRVGQVLPVYSAPSTYAWRGANGKACVSTNGTVFAAGWEGDWLLLMYETNNGAARVGYVSKSDIRGGVGTRKRLTFDHLPATVTRPCQLTDDPVLGYASICTLSAGTEVTYLTTFFTEYAWDYVETRVDGKRVRGFIPAENLQIWQDLSNMPEDAP